MVEKIPDVLQEPAPVIEVVELADSSVNLVVRPFTPPATYWGVHFAVMEGAKKALDAAGIAIPFPQRDVHLFQQKAS
jgi:small conductance mechanosensitive channel